MRAASRPAQAPQLINAPTNSRRRLVIPRSVPPFATTRKSKVGAAAVRLGNHTNSRSVTMIMKQKRPLDAQALASIMFKAREVGEFRRRSDKRR
jgi:hypothetical protein